MNGHAVNDTWGGGGSPRLKGLDGKCHDIYIYILVPPFHLHWLINVICWNILVITRHIIFIGA